MYMLILGISMTIIRGGKCTGGLTEAEEYAKKENEKHCKSIYKEPEFAKVEGASRKVLPPGNHVGSKRNGIRHRRQDDEGTGQVDEGGRTAEGDGTESGSNHRYEQCRVNGTTQGFVDSSEQRREWDGIVSCQSPVDPRVSEDGADATAQRTHQQDEQQTESSTGTSCRLGVDCCQRVVITVAQQSVHIRDGVANHNGEHKGVKPTKADLDANGFWKILSRLWKFLGHVGNRIRSSYCESTVQNSCQERNAARPACHVVFGERVPNERAGGMLFRHGCDHNNGDYSSDNDEEHPDVLRVGDETVGEYNHGCREPKDQDVRDVDMPSFSDVVRMIGRIHLYHYIGRYLYQSRQIKHPTIEVDPSGEEAHRATPFRASCYSRPVVYTSGGGNRRSKLTLRVSSSIILDECQKFWL